MVSWSTCGNENANLNGHAQPPVALVPQIIAAIEAIVDYDKVIAELESKLRSSRIFRSSPAAANVFAPRLMAVFGDDLTRFRSATEVQRNCGVAPLTERSGNKTGSASATAAPSFSVRLSWSGQG